MCQYIQLNISNLSNEKYLRYITNVEKLFNKYKKYLQDDFSTIERLSDLILSTSPYFWIVLDYNGRFMGFVYLDNFVGNRTKLYSAELTTCFEKYAWGTFTRYSAKIFLKLCFDKLNLEKITANIYPENFRTKSLLKNCGFNYETTLKNTTLRFGKMQDIDIYALYKTYY